MVMDINEIMSIIPHRQPFLLIDLDRIDGRREINYCLKERFL